MKIRGQKVFKPKDRVLKNILKNKDTGCWEWQRATKGFGYGYLTSGSRTNKTRKTVTAHRYSYEAFVGEIPKGLWVLHKCDNPKCVNPGHLFVGTMQDNVDDREAKGRNIPYIRFGEEHPQSRLTWDVVNYIRDNIKIRGDVVRLARKFGVDHKTVSDIKNFKTWIPQPPEREERK